MCFIMLQLSNLFSQKDVSSNQKLSGVPTNSEI